MSGEIIQPRLVIDGFGDEGAEVALIWDVGAREFASLIAMIQNTGSTMRNFKPTRTEFVAGLRPAPSQSSSLPEMAIPELPPPQSSSEPPEPPETLEGPAVESPQPPSQPSAGPLQGGQGQPSASVSSQSVSDQVRALRKMEPLLIAGRLTTSDVLKALRAEGVSLGKGWSSKLREIGVETFGDRWEQSGRGGTIITLAPPAVGFAQVLADLKQFANVWVDAETLVEHFAEAGIKVSQYNALDRVELDGWTVDRGKRRAMWKRAVAKAGKPPTGIDKMFAPPAESIP